MLLVSNLSVLYPRGRGVPPLRAVDGVSLSLGPRETLGLVGESGSGKTTIARAVLGLAPITTGSILFRGEDVTHASRQRRRELSAELQVVFQDPFSSLNPTRTVGQTLAETFRVHHPKMPAREVRTRVATMLEQVGIPPEAAGRYPVHFSGGQRQRIGIARALMVGPKLVICDEPTSALDLSVQAHILNLLQDLKRVMNLSLLFVSHDLAVVRHMADRIFVLYRGQVMEEGDSAAIYERPLHPYTDALLRAAPVPDPVEQRRARYVRMQRRVVRAATAPPSPDSCPFNARCPYAQEVCRVKRPLLESGPDGRAIACHRWREITQSLRVAG